MTVIIEWVQSIVLLILSKFRSKPAPVTPAPVSVAPVETVAHPVTEPVVAVQSPEPITVDVTVNEAKPAEEPVAAIVTSPVVPSVPETTEAPASDGDSQSK